MTLKRTSVAVALAVVLLGTATALGYARTIDLVGPDTAKRTMQVMIGLMLAAYSNLMPKDVGRWQASAPVMARTQSALRVGGWSLTLAGLAYAGLWAFAPLAIARIVGIVVIASAVLIAMGYGGWTMFACRSRHTTASR